MKRVYPYLLPGLLCLTPTSASAQIQSSSDADAANFGNSNYYSQQANTNTKDLVKYLLNLGSFLGYDLKEDPPKAPYNRLLDPGQSQIKETYAFNAYLGALPVSAFSQALSYFLPGSIPAAQSLNIFANYTFKLQNYNAPQGRKQGKVAVSEFMDQQTYQPDPVDQAVLNILSTPDFSYCLNNDESALVSNCELKNNNKVMTSILGKIPNPQEYFTYNYNKNFMSQLNSNVLLAPLMYTTENEGGGKEGEEKGLTANSQAQEASNFVLYASGLVTPPELPSYKNYSESYSLATSQRDSVEKRRAQGDLATYFMQLRSYAAKMSVGVSNLYYILSKRLPQNFGSDTEPQTSQAMSEFNMATWRLFKPQSTNQQGDQQQWINKINTASSASVQKEIAILLAEINYQMYLNRQQQERILLTNSIMLLQNANQPTPQLGSQSANAAPQ